MSSLLNTHLAPLPFAEYGQGCYIFDSNGKDYLDGSGGAMTVSIGHSVPEIVEAIAQQASKLCFAYRTQFSNRPAEELADLLVRLAPEGISQAFFVNSGSEASELALRSCIQYWSEKGRPSKTVTLGRQISYHGMTMGALSLSGHAERRHDYANLLHPLAVGPSLSPADFGQGSICIDTHRDEWCRAINEIGAEKVAALIFEPVIGAAGGAVTAPPGYMRMLREICDEHDVLLVADEVITGLGRTGKWFACEHDDVTPDVITVAKGLTGGYTPMGAVLYRDAIVDAIRKGSRTAPFGHTFSANPLSAATALAVLNYLTSRSVLENVALRAQQLSSGLQRIARERPCTLANIRGIGLLQGFDLVDPSSGAFPDPHMKSNAAFARDCQEEGLIVYPAGIGTQNHAAIISPPLTINANEMDELLNRLKFGLEKFSRRFPSL